MMGPSTVTLLAAVVAGFAKATVVHHARIEPELEPKSDKKFFDKDYPWDKRPAADKHYTFDHPYPAVQDTSDYDSDYVKDENNDGGKWDAQMDYDTLRSKIRRAEDALAKAKANMEKQEKEWHEAKDKHAQTSTDADAASAARKKAEQEAADAAAKVNKLEGASSKDGAKGTGGAVGDAVKNVKKEMDDLEKCKEELAAAKKRLKELMKQKEERDIKEKEEEEVRVKKMEEEKVEREKAKKEKADEKVKADKEVDEKTTGVKSWKSKIEEEKSEHAEASKSYEEELEDVKHTEAQLKEAEKNLRKFRRPPYVDDNGGVYNVPDGKSSARSSSLTAAALIVMVTASFC